MTDGPRIPPLPPSDRDPRTAELLDSLRMGDEDMNLFATLAHHPRLLKRWSAFGGLLLFGGALSDRDREVLILRTAANTGADYEWGHHVALATSAGLSSDEIGELARPEPAVGPDDALLVRAADELHSDGVLSDPTWEALAARYDEQQLIEVCMVVGQYHLVAFTLNSLRIEREPGFEGVPR
ncbi:MAG: carboxymuconolactone decarboxylase family protein [Actinobacteria bacterium]|nr:carboxymuconolactone decarboxylase family protein [Actinomycetota bacterium]